jgi:hypothetical protein
MLNRIKYIVEFLNKSIDFGKAKLLKAKDYVKHIFSASSHNTYVETISDKADSIHRRIKLSYEEDILDAYKHSIKKLVKYKRFGPVTLAIDITKEQFYGKTRNFHIFHCGGDMESKAEFHYIVVSIVNADKNIPLMALPVTLGCDRAELIEKLLSFVKKLLRIKLVLFDRGLTSSEIIHTLQKLKLDYLMLSKQYSSYKNMLESVEDIAVVEHGMKYEKDKSIWKVNTNLVLIKGEEYDWCFYTSLCPRDAKGCIWTYKRRWQIETNFRVEDEARIKSKSVNYLVRYFYFMLTLLLHAIWLVFPYKQFKFFLIQLYEYFIVKDIKVNSLSC